MRFSGKLPYSLLELYRRDSTLCGIPWRPCPKAWSNAELSGMIRMGSYLN